MHERHFDKLPPGKMELSTFRAVLDRLTAHFRLAWIILSRDGEPFLHPELERFVAAVNERGVRSSLGSNGSLITEERASRLIENGLSQMRGDFCADHEEYERLRAGGSFEQSLAGYRHILQAAKEYNADFVLGMIDLHTYDLVHQADIEKSIDRLRRLFEGYERWLRIGPAVMHNALGESKETLSTSQQRFEHGNTQYNRCHHPWIELVIDYRGNAVACCRDLRSEYRIGNILEVDDIDREIWNGARMRFLRKSLRRKKPEDIDVCRKCDLPYGVSYAGNTVRGKVLKFMTK
jgi:radical SAM protein with 4Fe4S-binding SPASM domain